MNGRMRAAGAAITVAGIATVILLTVHGIGHPAALGPLPAAAVEWAVFAAGAWLVLRAPARLAVPLVLLGGIAVQLAALSAPPRASDDLYRYLWDGRVQAAGIDPYRYVPAASQLTGMRDHFLWPSGGAHCVTAAAVQAAGRTGLSLAPGCTRINLPSVHTIYPPVAEGYFTAVHLASPPGSGSLPIQLAAALCAIATTILLLAGLRSLGRDPRLAVLWAWCPAVGLEAGNNAHVDVLAAFCTAAALLTLARAGGPRRAAAGGALLGLAIATKLSPVLVTPAVLRRRPIAVAAAAAGATITVYLPHLLAVGGGVVGFLPGYLSAQGYSSGDRFQLVSLIVPGAWATVAAAAILAVTGLAVLVWSDPDQPWRGAVVMTGAALAVTTPWITWYALLLIVLVAMDGRAEWLALAAARYLTPLRPLPHVVLPHPGQIGYGAAVLFVAGVSLVRYRRSRWSPGGPAAQPASQPAGQQPSVGPAAPRDPVPSPS
jgi:hypothetical protein